MGLSKAVNKFRRMNSMNKKIDLVTDVKKSTFGQRNPHKEILEKIRQACCDASTQFSVNTISVQTGIRWETCNTWIQILRDLSIISKYDDSEKYYYRGLTADYDLSYFTIMKLYTELKESLQIIEQHRTMSVYELKNRNQSK